MAVHPSRSSRRGVLQQPVEDPVLPAAQNGRRAVGHLGVAEDQGGQVLLVAFRVGAVQDALIENLVAWGPMPPKMPDGAFFVP